MKKRTARRIFVSMVALMIAATFQMSGAYAQAGVLTAKSISLSDSVPAANSNYTIKFTTGASATLTEFDFTYSTAASAGSTPTGTAFASTTLGSISDSGSKVSGTWTLSTASGKLILKNTANTTVIPASDAVTVTFNAVTNPGVSSGCPASGGTQTCFIQMATLDNTGTTQDTGAATFTLIPAVSSTATIDPSLTFTIGGLGSAVHTDGTLTTTQAASATTLPFGDLTANQSSIVAQSIQTVTNASAGYQVTMEMTTQMTGTSSAKIAPFDAGGTVTWSAPALWAAPTGTDTTGAATANAAAWIGANTSDSRIGSTYANWATPANLFGPVSTSSSDLVAQSSGPDQSTVVDVTYKIQNDVYMPADTYTGTLEYYVIATY